jgi:death on curing protein
VSGYRWLAQWTWVADQIVFDAHDYLINRFGGLSGVRDHGLVLSALARPRNAAAYGQANVYQLGAEYLFGLATTQGFNDGNKRTAWATAETFLNLNGVSITYSFLQAEQRILDVANHTMTVPQIEAWIRTL